MIDLHPTKCNICGGEVELVYWASEDSRYRYRCNKCGAYIGTCINKPNKAKGLLCDKKMQDLKKKCNRLFDSFVVEQHHSHDRYVKLRKRLSIELGIPLRECFFSYFDMDTLSKSYLLLSQWYQDKLENPNKFWMLTNKISEGEMDKNKIKEALKNLYYNGSKEEIIYSYNLIIDIKYVIIRDKDYFEVAINSYATKLFSVDHNLLDGIRKFLGNELDDYMESFINYPPVFDETIKQIYNFIMEVRNGN